jgi:hypothetical protein
MKPLREIEILTDALYLDPNNPRFADLHDKVQPVPRDRIIEQGVQEKAQDRILDDRFEVDQLKDSIRTIGFLTVDRLVVAPLPQEGKYVVTEGNRRLGAIKSLLQDHKNGEADLSPDVLESMRIIPVLIIDELEEAKQEHIARVLQGVRHVSGIRPWGPYQQAQVVAMMIDDGREQTEICEVLGLQKRRINILRRCFYALDQMRRDDDYGDKAKPPLFSHFDEAFRLPTLREWLDWDDERNLCMNEEHRKLFYSWLVGSEDDEGFKHRAKITDPKEIRRLPQLMTDAVLFRRFCDNPALSLDEAMQGVPAPKSAIQWRDFLGNLVSILNQVPAVDLENATKQDEELLVRAQEICNRHLKIVKSSQT